MSKVMVGFRKLPLNSIRLAAAAAASQKTRVSASWVNAGVRQGGERARGTGRPWLTKQWSTLDSCDGGTPASTTEPDWTTLASQTYLACRRVNALIHFPPTHHGVVPSRSHAQ